MAISTREEIFSERIIWAWVTSSSSLVSVSFDWSFSCRAAFSMAIAAWLAREQKTSNSIKSNSRSMARIQIKPVILPFASRGAQNVSAREFLSADSKVLYTSSGIKSLGLIKLLCLTRQWAMWSCLIVSNKLGLKDHSPREDIFLNRWDVSSRWRIKALSTSMTLDTRASIVSMSLGSSSSELMSLVTSWQTRNNSWRFRDDPWLTTSKSHELFFSLHTVSPIFLPRK